VLDQIRSDPVTAPVPVIIASILDEKARGLAEGADEYLIKPVGRVELLQALGRVHALPATVAGRSAR
jgi:CheY-like chemotaxis protein